jgi:hypothetical protein
MCVDVVHSCDACDLMYDLICAFCAYACLFVLYRVWFPDTPRRSGTGWSRTENVQGAGALEHRLGSMIVAVVVVRHIHALCFFVHLFQEPRARWRKMRRSLCEGGAGKGEAPLPPQRHAR